MNDEQITMKGGDEHDIEQYAKQNGADFSTLLEEEGKLVDTFFKKQVNLSPREMELFKSFLLASHRRVLGKIGEMIEEKRFKWKYIKGGCSICTYLEHSGESHQCEVYNSCLDEILSSLQGGIIDTTK